MIKIVDIDLKLKNLLKKYSVDSLEDLLESEAEKLFCEVIEEYKGGNLSLDELSAFGFKLFHGAAKKNPNSDLFRATLSASELNFAVRSKAVFDNIPEYLEDIEKFWESRK